MRYTLENVGRMPLALMFVSLGPAIATYERALAQSAGDAWPLRAEVEQRLALARELQRQIFGDGAVAPLRTRFDVLVARDSITCASCHRSR